MHVHLQPSQTKECKWMHSMYIYINIYLYMSVYMWYGNSYVEWFQHEQFRFHAIFLARINIACCNFIQTKMEKKINKKRKKKKPKWKAVNILNAAAEEAQKIVCDKKLKNK